MKKSDYVYGLLVTYSFGMSTYLSEQRHKNIEYKSRYYDNIMFRAFICIGFPLLTTGYYSAKLISNYK